MAITTTPTPPPYTLTFAPSPNEHTVAAPTADQLDSKLTVNITGMAIATQYPLAFVAAMDRIRWATSGGGVVTANLYCQPRDKHGWLEWIITYYNTSGHSLLVGMIQRDPASPFEFHS